jgi:hypothetical protein
MKEKFIEMIKMIPWKKLFSWFMSDDESEENEESE